jgi:predicted dehydrogenase
MSAGNPAGWFAKGHMKALRNLSEGRTGRAPEIKGVPSQAKCVMKRIRCGIIGFGFAGAQHAEAMRRLGSVEVAAICAEDVNKARDKARSWNIPVVYASYRELLNDKSIEVVDIVTPTYLHHRIALAALQEGKHLIVEKPLATKALEAREMLGAAQSSGLVHAVTFNYRFNPLVEQARVMVARGELGPINLVHGHYLQEWLLYDTDYSWRLDPEKSGPAAMVADAGCHWFDLVEYTTGLRVESVLADLSTTIKLRRPRFYSQETFTSGTTADRRAFAETRNVAVTVPDFGAILLRFNNGARGMFTTSSLCAGHKNDLRFEIHGAVASLR